MRRATRPCSWVVWLACVGVTWGELVFRAPGVTVSQSASSRAVGSRAAPSRPEVPSTPEPEQYFVQHEVTPEDAHRAALLPPAPADPHERAGCGRCSPRELYYCSARALSDHCCCDGRLREPLPTTPHTCYTGPAPCRVLAPHCAAYWRLVACCCSELWRAAGRAERVASPAGPVVLVVLTVLFTTH